MGADRTLQAAFVNPVNFFEPWQWAIVIVGAFSVGLAKTGIPGLGILFAAIMANVMPTREASGFVLPLLIAGDVVAVLAYRAHAKWAFLWKLFPWTAVGVGLGYLAMGRIDDRQARLLIGIVICGMVVMHVWRQRGRGPAQADLSPWLAPVFGVLGGFTTLVANAAGPLMALYFLAMRLPKMEFVGTAAMFFLVLNVFKVPFMMDLGLVNTGSLQVNALLVPAVLAGAWLGRRLLPKIDQKRFEVIALALSAAAGLRLLIS